MRLEARQVVKRYGQFAALDGASFETSHDARVVALPGRRRDAVGFRQRVRDGERSQQYVGLSVRFRSLPHTGPQRDVGGDQGAVQALGGLR